MAGTAAVAVVGFALARYGSGTTTASPPPLDQQASVADFKINYPAGWRVQPPIPVPLVPLGDVLALAADGDKRSRLVIGTQQTTEPASLPPRLAAAVPSTTRPQVVTLGRQRFLRYLNLTPQGQNLAESVYALPTTAGTVTAVCSAPAFSTRFTSDCERLLSTLKLTTGDVASLTVDPGYALELNRVLRELDRVRRSAGPALRSGHLRDRVRAASALAAAHSQAATAASHIDAGTVSAGNQALVSALTANADAYKALAHAAARRDVSAYGRAETALSAAGSALAAAYDQLRRLGYQIS